MFDDILNTILCLLKDLPCGKREKREERERERDGPTVFIVKLGEDGALIGEPDLN